MDAVRTILFDLDGTITDSASGIVQAYKYAFDEMGIIPPSDEVIQDGIGRPLRENLGTYLPSSKCEEAVDHYFYYYDYLRGGLTDNRLYAGIVDMLVELKSRDVPLYIVSGKLIELILPILNLFELDDFFSGLYGAHRDGTNSSKDELIASALAGSGLDPRTTLMVGDRSFDVLAAKKNGVRSVAVTWGYGSENELVTTSPDWIISDPSELIQIVSGAKSLAS